MSLHFGYSIQKNEQPSHMRVLSALVIIILITAILSACGSHVWHSVRKGETLYSISFRYGQDYKQVAQWNNIAAPYVINPGQAIRIAAPPPGQRSPVISTATKNTPAIVSSSTVTTTRKNTAAKTQPKNTIIVTTKPAPHYPDKVIWRWPVRGKVIQTFSDKQPGRKGIDISAARGTLIKAAASGRIVYTGAGLTSYGKLIIIKHNEQFLSAYAHNQKLLVKEGQDIAAGTAIAEMGDSGTDRVKLHFEVRRKGKPVNPLRYLPSR